MANLNGKRVAVLATDGFEQVELEEPVKALKAAGAIVKLIAPEEIIRGWKFTEWGDKFRADYLLDFADPMMFDALFLPGGVLNPDKLRINTKAIEFITNFTESFKPIAAICHGPQSLIETGYLKGKNVTSFYSVKTDLINAGAFWADREVVVDGNLVTSRKPSDIPAFNLRMIEVFQEIPEVVGI
jgi:protease I